MTMDLHLLSIIVRKYYVFYKFNMSSDVFKSNSNSSRSLIKGCKIEEQYCKSAQNLLYY